MEDAADNTVVETDGLHIGAGDGQDLLARFLQHEPPMPLNMRFGIAIKEGGKGSGDMTRRALNVTCLPGEFWGDDPSEGFGAVMMDGNYNIRER